MDMTGVTKTLIMGILNVTPDSFYDGGKYSSPDTALKRAELIFSEGADIIDVGGESTRPGSMPVSSDEEMSRVCPVIERISREIDIKISVDTTKSEVAEEAVKCGASIINDISGLTYDSRIADVAYRHNAHLVLMHIKGKPADMQKNTEYDNLIQDILDFLNESATIAMNKGVDKSRIIIDPGIGFGKSMEQNYGIIDNIERFAETGFPVLVGLSRKSLISRLYSRDEERLFATIALNSIVVNKGASIIRVHDVKEHRLAIDSVDFLNFKGNKF
jgi:dihydropteroate synthase